jgi:hypothetical protein
LKTSKDEQIRDLRNRSVEKSNENEFIIPFVGLKQGKHVFEFDITDAFFETFEYSIIQKGKVHIEFTLDKKETMIIGGKCRNNLRSLQRYN